MGGDEEIKEGRGPGLTARLQVNAGDMLISVDGKKIRGIRFDQLTSLMLGEEVRRGVEVEVDEESLICSQNSLVELGLLGNDHEMIKVALKRGRVGPVGRAADKVEERRKEKGEGREKQKNERGGGEREVGRGRERVWGLEEAGALP